MTDVNQGSGIDQDPPLQSSADVRTDHMQDRAAGSRFEPNDRLDRSDRTVSDTAPYGEDPQQRTTRASPWT
jgi:hypothetical protein